MTLKEFYEAIGADYDEIMKRIGNEALITRLLFKFAEDENYRALCEAVQKKEYEAAFFAAHTLKGVCQNLGISNLGGPASELTDSLRNGKQPESWELLDVITAEYEKTIQNIQKLQ